jgi:hypothetical protein
MATSNGPSCSASTTGGQKTTNFRLEGQLELAALAKMFSEQLGLYRDVQVESGQIWLQIASHPGAIAGRSICAAG